MRYILTLLLFSFLLNSSSSAAFDGNQDSTFQAQSQADSLEYEQREDNRQARLEENRQKSEEKRLQKMKREMEHAEHSIRKQRSNVFSLIVGVPIAVILLTVFVIVRRNRRREAQLGKKPNSGPPTINKKDTH